MKPFYFVVSALTWCLTWFMLGLLGFSIGAYAGLRVISLIRASNPFFVIPAIIATLVTVYLSHVWARRRLFEGEPIVEACTSPCGGCRRKSRLAEIAEQESNE